MRILSSKDYSWLMDRIETLSNENERLQMKVDEITKEQPNDCKNNEESDMRRISVLFRVSLLKCIEL